MVNIASISEIVFVTVLFLGKPQKTQLRHDIHITMDPTHDINITMDPTAFIKKMQALYAWSPYLKCNINNRISSAVLHKKAFWFKGHSIHGKIVSPEFKHT